MYVLLIQGDFIYVIKHINTEERLNDLPNFSCVFSGEPSLELRSPDDIFTCGMTHHSPRGVS